MLRNRPNSEELLASINEKPHQNQPSSFQPMLTVLKGKQLQVHMDKEWNNILAEG